MSIGCLALSVLATAWTSGESSRAFAAASNAVELTSRCSKKRCNAAFEHRPRASFDVLARFALSALARQLPVPTPILQVAAGLLVGALPGISLPMLSPDLIFFVFLPPVLWSAAPVP